MIIINIMNIKENIESIFSDKAFQWPLFYQYPGGLRFKLSEEGTYINQFITAHQKGMEVCNAVFNQSNSITICIKISGGKSLLSTLSTLRSLRDAEIYPLSDKEHWTDFDDEWRKEENFSDCLWHYIAFNIPTEHLTNALWCAIASDFGFIKPAPRAAVYLFNLDRKIMIHPYDDRGMDIVGPNKQFLKMLYHNFGHYLLDYDRKAMDAVFG